MRILVTLLVACSASQPASSIPPQGSAASGFTPDGSLVLLDIAGERITSVTEGVDTGTWLWPPIVDSHVHLAFLPVAQQLAEHGVGAVVDLAAPDRTLGGSAPIAVLASGPMLTSPGGYPLDSWGADGYGIGCGDAACITSTIDRLAARGARVIKLPLDRGGLEPALVAHAVNAAHAKQLKVVVHALSNSSAALGAAAGADVLAHTPVEPLSDSTIAAWRGRAVISTLAAFGGSAATVENLRRLRAAGVIVLYGTDLGNLRADGPSREEVALLRGAGLDDVAIVDAMTIAPLKFWGFELGTFTSNSEATFLVLPGDPRRDAGLLLAPRAVFTRGRMIVR